MPKLDQALLNYLAKGTFPLLDSGGLLLWSKLLDALEADADQTITEIGNAMTGRHLDFGNTYSSSVTVNKVTVNTGNSDLINFLGEMHTRLSKDHGIATRPPVQDLIRRVRALCYGHIPPSDVKLGLDGNTRMGNGLVAPTLTFLPDPAWGVTFGSVPDQDVIGNLAPAWKQLKRRAYEPKVLKSYGGKPHYVLAHLLNHNLNGSGSEPRNVIPFWATANTQMAKQAENYVKDLVLRGVTVSYNIALGGAVGMTKGRKAAYDMADAEQRKVIEVEQHLCSHIVINCSALDVNGVWQPIVVGLVIDNYVPETVPYLLS